MYLSSPVYDYIQRRVPFTHLSFIHWLTDMIHEYSSADRKGDSLDHLAHTMQVNGINLDAEVTGAVARKIFEVGLEVRTY